MVARVAARDGVRVGGILVLVVAQVQDQVRVVLGEPGVDPLLDLLAAAMPRRKKK